MTYESACGIVVLVILFLWLGIMLSWLVYCIVCAVKKLVARRTREDNDTIVLCSNC